MPDFGLAELGQPWMLLFLVAGFVVESALVPFRVGRRRIKGRGGAVEAVVRGEGHPDDDVIRAIVRRQSEVADELDLRTESYLPPAAAVLGLVAVTAIWWGSATGRIGVLVGEVVGRGAADGVARAAELSTWGTATTWRVLLLVCVVVAAVVGAENSDLPVRHVPRLAARSSVAVWSLSLSGIVVLAAAPWPVVVTWVGMLLGWILWSRVVYRAGRRAYRVLLDRLGGVPSGRPAATPPADPDQDPDLAEELAGLRAHADELAAEREDLLRELADLRQEREEAAVPDAPDAQAPDALDPAWWELASPARPDWLAGFAVRGVLGRTAMSVVYLCLAGPDSRGRSRPVVVKCVHTVDDPQNAESTGILLRRAKREAELAQACASPYMPEFISSGFHGDQFFIASEALPHPTLHKVVRNGRRFDEDRLHRLGHGLASALSVVHARDGIHRDVNPRNVLWSERQPYLLDLGIAAMSTTGYTDLTSAGQRLGTLLYMSPERQRAEIAADPAADVWSWGAVMMYAATGVGPYPSPTAAAAGAVDLSALDGGDLGPRLRELIVTALDDDPAARPTARAVVAELAAIRY